MIHLLSNNKSFTKGQIALQTIEDLAGQLIGRREGITENKSMISDSINKKKMKSSPLNQQSFFGVAANSREGLLLRRLLNIKSHYYSIFMANIYLNLHSSPIRCSKPTILLNGMVGALLYQIPFAMHSSRFRRFHVRPLSSLYLLFGLGPVLFVTVLYYGPFSCSSLMDLLDVYCGLNQIWLTELLGFPSPGCSVLDSQVPSSYSELCPSS